VLLVLRMPRRRARTLLPTTTPSETPPGDMAAQRDVAAPASVLHSEFLQPEDFELLLLLGEGSFGKVLLVREKATAALFAMKVISKRLVEETEQTTRAVMAERAVMASVDNPFFVHLHAAFQTRRSLYLVMGVVEGGELEELLAAQPDRVLPEDCVRFFAAQLVVALTYLHERAEPIIYRDLKPENCLLDREGNLVLTDFGLAKTVTAHEGGGRKRAQTVCGTPGRP